MNIILLNAEAGGNKGAEAMLDTLIDFLIHRFDDIKIFIEVSNPQAMVYSQNTFIKKFNDNYERVIILPFSPKKIFRPYNLSQLDKIDYVIDIGGINFHDTSNVNAILRNLVRFLPFIRRKNKIIFFTQDFGPATKPLNKLVGQFILRKSKAIFTRSTFSKDQLLNNLKIDKNKIFGPFPDITTLQKDNCSYLDNAFAAKPYILLCPSAIMYLKHGNDYKNLFSKVYHYFSANFNVVFLVNNFSNNSGTSDLKLSQELHQECKHSFIYCENSSSIVIKKIIADARLTISSRYHVVVGSLLGNVPSLAIGWNPKYRSFLNLYNRGDWNLEFVESEKCFQIIKEKVYNINFSKEEDYLINQNVIIKNKAKKSFELLEKIMKNED